jgi:putative glutamine amidotransferase
MPALLIAITTYARNAKGDYPLPANYVECVRRAGGAVLLLPPGEARLDNVLERIDGLVLTGGGDIDPSRYGGVAHETNYMVDEERDEMELVLAQRAIERELPTLAICRGTQIVNIALGGTLIPHLPDVFGNSVAHRLPPREPTPHPIQVEEGSRTARILGATSIEPMSWHHQAVDENPRSFRVVAQASDGVPEAFELDGNENLLAVQWHPELTADRDPTQHNLFTWLVECAVMKG